MFLVSGTRHSFYIPSIHQSNEWFYTIVFDMPLAPYQDLGNQIEKVRKRRCSYHTLGKANANACA